ncbi:hypothetical protein F383_16384 [Gossypium arboreum]|uniref:Uncharacterized protein n=1 Tax=Gossypium arboreum TaxID=29729 RepID=A0A0B0Q3Q3_GOSAR|nr:hypothetical protein F383_16384 [Gossypium arboreum]
MGFSGRFSYFLLSGPANLSYLFRPGISHSGDILVRCYPVLVHPGRGISHSGISRFPTFFSSSLFTFFVFNFKKKKSNLKKVLITINVTWGFRKLCSLSSVHSFPISSPIHPAL